MFGDVVSCRLRFSHDNPLKISCQTQGRFDIRRLRTLVTTGQQDHYRLPYFRVIDPIAGTIINPQFRNTLAHGFHIPRIPKRQAFDSHQNASPRMNVTQTVNPFCECLGLADFNYGYSVATWLRVVNGLFASEYAGPR